MALVIDEQAPDVGLVKNKIIYRMTTDRYLDFEGQAGVYRFEVVSAPDIGDSFVIAWDDFNVSIQVKVGTLNEFNQDTSHTVLNGTTTTTKQATALAIKALLDDNVIIASNYTLTVINEGSDYFVEFEQKKIGAEYAIESFDTDAWHEWTQVSLSASELYDGRFYVLTKLFVKNDQDEYDFVTDILTKPLKDQTLSVNIADKIAPIVDSYVLPAIGQSSELRQPDIIKEYRLLIFEKKPNALGSLQPVAQVDGKSAWFAGFTPEDFATTLDPLDAWFRAGKRWLTWFPNNQEVREDQEHFLSFINHDTSIEA